MCVTAIPRALRSIIFNDAFAFVQSWYAQGRLRKGGTSYVMVLHCSTMVSWVRGEKFLPPFTVYLHVVHYSSKYAAASRA